ncbi:MAG: hypothetical protein KJ718_04525 [Nanoarchaeota archaeon]|nr:hypothetical protein [Nanoarchaeota archaeon]
MANQNIINWLNEGKKRGFSVQFLKKKLMEKSFLEKDVDEAVAVVEGSVSKSIPQKINLFDKSAKVQTKESAPLQETKPMPSQETKISQIGKVGKGGIKWMKMAGIIGIVLLIVNLALIVLNFAVRETFNSLLINQIISIIFYVIFVALFFFYYLGFVKLGKHTNERLLSLGAWFVIIPMFLYIILSIVAGILVYPLYTDFLIIGESGTLKTTFLIIGIVGVILFLLNLIGFLLFSLGLMKAGKQVKFAKVAGILNLVVFVSGMVFTIGMVVLIYSILNLFSKGILGIDLLAEVVGVGYWVIYSFIALYALWILAMIFGILALFDGSKKFEG